MFTPSLKHIHATPMEAGLPQQPRVIFNIAAIADGAIPITRIKLYETGNHPGDDQFVPQLLGADGRIVFYTSVLAQFRVGDIVKISGVDISGYGLPVDVNRSLSIVEVSDLSDNFDLYKYTLSPVGWSGDDFEFTGTFEVQLKYQYVEFYGCKSGTGTANTGETLIGPSAVACFQPLGKAGTPSSIGNIGYSSTPIDGKQWNLSHWVFKVAADGDGVLAVIWD